MRVPHSLCCFPEPSHPHVVCAAVGSLLRKINCTHPSGRSSPDRGGTRRVSQTVSRECDGSHNHTSKHQSDISDIGKHLLAK